MKLCAAQTRPVRGDMARNMDQHYRLIDLAVAAGAGLLVFPELSLTGYEPALAEALATTQDDGRFDRFQHMADARRLTIGLGVPTRHRAGVCISMVLFRPHAPRQTYSKQYLHPDEEAFFVPGQGGADITVHQTRVAPAICYELSVPEHAENAHKSGAEVYIASVAKSVSGVGTAMQRLSGIASDYGMTVLMANCVGLSDGMECGGKTSVWNTRGLLAGQLDDSREGILMFDTDTQEVLTKLL